MNNEMAEALSAVTPVTPAVEKIRPGATLIAIELDRDPARSGAYTTSIGGKNANGRVIEWRVGGCIVAIKAGKVVAKNHLTGNWNSVTGHYEVKACRAVFCSKCRDDSNSPRAIMLPHAVWDAKDAVRERSHGQDTMKGWGAWRVLREAGRCECGSKLYEDVELENARLNALAQKALKAVEKMEKPVPEFVPPAWFTLVEAGKGNLPQAWNWLQTGLAGAKPNPCSAVAHVKGDRKALMFNPGFWIGQVNDIAAPHMTGYLFGDDKSADDGIGFNPHGVDGL